MSETKLGELTVEERRVLTEGVTALRQKAERCAEDGVHPEAEMWNEDADALHRLLNRLAAPSAAKEGEG